MKKLSWLAGLMFCVSPILLMADTPPIDAESQYDRLDGMGTSGKKVNVVEWEGNLEIHVYPAGSLKGLALKLDKTNKDRPVMVIGYRFENHPDTQLIRRAILGIDLREGFKAYKDPSASDYDKIIISNNGLAGPLALFKLEPAPAQNYPDAPPALAENSMGEARDPASRMAKPQAPSKKVPEKSLDEDSGAIRPFFFHTEVKKR